MPWIRLYGAGRAIRPRHNVFVWIGFGTALFAFLSYIPLFAPIPATRDVPWVNYLLFLVAACLLAVGLRRAFRQPELYRGKISGSILGVLTVFMFGFFCYGILYASKDVPSSASALHVGQQAPAFTLASADGRQVTLSKLLADNRGVVLIFYRGYW